MRLGSIIFNNFWAKMIALALAIATWFYVSDLVTSDSFVSKKESVEQIISRHTFIAKEVPIKVSFSGESPNGYKVLFDKIKVDPEKIMIVGPKDVVKDIVYIRTKKVDLSEYTRSIKLDLGIESNSKLVRLDDNIVRVYVPIEHISKK